MVAWAEQGVRVPGGSHVETEGAIQGRRTVVARASMSGVVARVQAKQVVQPVAPRSRALHQLRVHQSFEQPLGLRLAMVEQACDHRQAEVWPVGEAEQRERGGRGLVHWIRAGGQLVEGDVEAGADPDVDQLQLVEPALLVGEPVRQRPHVLDPQPRRWDERERRDVRRRVAAQALELALLGAALTVLAARCRDDGRRHRAVVGT
jgi:hypothetical protein